MAVPASAPVAATTPADDTPVVDLATYYRWADARTLIVPRDEKQRWTPLTALYADYLRFFAAADPAAETIEQAQFEQALVDDTRHRFEMLEVEPEGAAVSSLASCTNRAFRAPIQVAA
jgi:hypothetical protein